MATIMKGKFNGQNVLILRIPIIPTDLSIQFKRIQFSIRQSLEVCGINIEMLPARNPSSLFVIVKANKAKI